MILEIPEWCKIGKYIEFKMYDPNEGKAMWFKDKIISYSKDGFFHQAANCPVYHNKFSDYGKTVRECEENNVLIGGKMTKLKDLRKMKIWDYADIITLLDTDGNEIEITSESKRRKINNKEVTSWDTELKNGLRVLNVVLNT